MYEQDIHMHHSLHRSLANVQYQSSLPAAQSERLHCCFAEQACTSKTSDRAPKVALMLFKTAFAGAAWSMLPYL